MNDLEYILDFAVNLGSQMLNTGANLERVNDTMNRICLSYHLGDISIFSLNTTISLCAKSLEGETAVRQVSVAAASNHLEKLKQFNDLSRKVCAETPPPSTLASLLAEAEDVKEYPMWTIVLGYVTAMTCLCGIFGGGILDIVAVDLITVVLFWMIRILNKPNLNHIITNVLCMWIAGTLAILMIRIGVGKQFFIIAITNSMMLIPGIPLVNATRNILCGNEMNGILEILKVILETAAIVLGLALSIYMFGGLIQW